MNSTKQNIPPLSRKKAAQLRKAKEKQEKNKAYYERNREKIIEKSKERRGEKQESRSRVNTCCSIKVVQKRNKAKEIREENRAKEIGRAHV